MFESAMDVLHDIFVGTYPGPRFQVVRRGGPQRLGHVVMQLRQALADLAGGGLDNESLARLCRSLVRGQRRAFGQTQAGSWAVCASDRDMPMDAREDVIHTPTRIATAILSLSLLEHSPIADAIPGLRPALARGMAFCARHLPEHSAPFGADGGGPDILRLGRVDDVLRLDLGMCSDLARMLGLDALPPGPVDMVEAPRPPKAGPQATPSHAKLTGWSKVTHVFTHPDGDKILCVESHSMSQRLVTIGGKGKPKATPVATRLKDITGRANIAPWGGHFVGFGSDYRYTAGDGERNMYATAAHLHTLPDGNTISSHSLFVGDTTSAVGQCFWDLPARRLILNCKFFIKILSLDGAEEIDGAFAWKKGISTNTNFRFSDLCLRPNYRPEDGGFQFVSSIHDAWRHSFSGIAVTEVPSGRQWFLDDQRWRPWPQGFDDRCETPSVRPKEAVYSADGRYILVLGSDRVLRSWSADGFRPWPSRLVDLKDAKGMCALPGARVAVWNSETLILADHRDGRVPPMSWKARHQIDSVQVLPHCDMIAVKAWNPPDEGGGHTLHLLDQADGREIWRSQDHLGSVAEVFPIRSGVVITDGEERWWVVQ